MKTPPLEANYEVLRISRVLLSKRGEWWGEVFEDAELVSLKDLEEIIESMGEGRRGLRFWIRRRRVGRQGGERSRLDCDSEGA